MGGIPTTVTSAGQHQRCPGPVCGRRARACRCMAPTGWAPTRWVDINVFVVGPPPPPVMRRVTTLSDMPPNPGRSWWWAGSKRHPVRNTETSGRRHSGGALQQSMDNNAAVFRTEET